MKKETVGTLIMMILSLVVVVGFVLTAPIPQDPGYHSFSDTVMRWATPNALNVWSNLPFLIVGIMGIWALSGKRRRDVAILDSNYWAYVMLFFGAALVGVGSSYYHLAPSNQALVWDRLPMTLAFMAFFSIIISETVSETWGRRLLIPLLIVGVSSVAYWWFTENRGAGDLRFYAVVQFYPILSIPIMLFCFRTRFSHVSAYWWLLATYAAAKVFETFDAQIHAALGVISGHSIKHVLPAIGLYVLIRSFRKRSPQQ